MKLTPVLLCSALALLVSAPVWADRVDPGFVQLTEHRQFSAVAGGRSGPSDSTFSETLSLLSVPRPGTTITLFNFVDSDFRDYDSRSSRASKPSERDQKNGDTDGDSNVLATPEPGSFVLLLFGLCGLGFVAYRHKTAARVIQPYQQFSTGL